MELDPRVSPLSPPPRRGATPGHVVEVVRATIHEAQARARDQVPDGAGDEDLTGCGAAQPPGTNVDRDAAHVWPLCTRSAATSCRWRGELDTEDTLRIYFLAFYVISLTVCLVKVVPASLKVPTPERRAKPPIWVLAVLPVLRAVVGMQKN